MRIYMRCIIYPVLVTLLALVQVQIEFQPRNSRKSAGVRGFNRLPFLKTLTWRFNGKILNALVRSFHRQR